MNSEQVISIYESMCDITGNMLAAAQSRDWEKLVELESCCASYVATLSAREAIGPLTAPLRARKVKMIHQILAHDREIRDLTTPWMAELSALINSTGAERRLNHAYGA